MVPENAASSPKRRRPRRHVVRQAKWSEDQKWEGGAGGYCCIAKLTNEIIGRPNPGDALLFLYRRFGPSYHGGDPDKDVANYRLTTPDPEVCLGIRLTAMRTSFSWLVSEPLYESGLYHGRDSTRRAEVVKRIHDAITYTLCDLTRPVYVRDVPIDMIGQLGWDDPRLSRAANRYVLAGQPAIRPKRG